MSRKWSRRKWLKVSGLSAVGLTVPFSLTEFRNNNSMKTNSDFDVIIIGGSYAGLSAAMALGRSLRKVLLIDSGKPCNRFTPHSHNFITQDGAVPSEISKIAKEQVLRYDTVQFLEGLAVKARKKENGFEIEIDSGERFNSKKLIISTGVRDVFPDIKGFEDCWGKTVIHCPYCHGYELKGEKTAIMANAERAFHLASLVRNLTENLTIIRYGETEFSDEQLSTLKKHSISVLEKEIIEIGHNKGKISALIFDDGTKEEFDALYAGIPFEQTSHIPVSLGCELTEKGHIQTEMFQKTNVEGVFACGDCTSPMRSVAFAVAAGNITGAMVNHQLAGEEF